MLNFLKSQPITTDELVDEEARKAYYTREIKKTALRFVLTNVAIAAVGFTVIHIIDKKVDKKDEQ